MVTKQEFRNMINWNFPGSSEIAIESTKHTTGTPLVWIGYFSHLNTNYTVGYDQERGFRIIQEKRDTPTKHIPSASFGGCTEI